MRILIGFVIALILSGCENFYSKIYDEKIKNEQITCLNVEGKNTLLNSKVIKVLKSENIPVKSNCPYTLKVSGKLLSKCSSPTAKSIGADFDGFLRFDLFKNNQLKYRCQMDWKGEFSSERIKELVQKMKKDLKGI